MMKDEIEEETKVEKNKWRCSQCHFDNYILLSSCEICEAEKPKVEDEKKVPSAGIIQCRNKDCQADNPLDVDYCLVCAHPLFEEKKPPFLSSEKSRIDKDLIKCKYCSLENHISQIVCLNCNKSLKAIKPVIKPHLFGASYANCPNCHRILNKTGMFSNEFQQCGCNIVDTSSTTTCTFCDIKVSKEDRQYHADTCKERSQFFDKNKNPSFQRCSDLQIETVLYMHMKYEPIHYKNQNALLKKIRKIGFTQEDLGNLHHYITHYAPIIVHMSANRHFKFFDKDTHYRNYFQVHKVNSGHMGGGGRVQWEDRMFDNLHHDASNYQRVKYGTMNFTNDPNGVAVCAGYGQSYFLLKPHMRNRCTITDMDSASPTATIATFRFINHLLMKLSDEELRSAFEGSKGKQMLSNVIGAYKEIQIHGPIQFAKDIQRVYICKAQLGGNRATIIEMVKRFCDKYKLQFQQFQLRKPKSAYLMSVGKAGISMQSVPDRFIKEGQSEDKDKMDIEDNSHKRGKRGRRN